MGTGHYGQSGLLRYVYVDIQKYRRVNKSNMLDQLRNGQIVCRSPVLLNNFEQRESSLHKSFNSRVNK